MASNGGKINFQVGFNVDKSGLSQMQSLFQQIASLAQEPANKLNTGLQQAAKTASTLDGILSRTFNTELGTLNVTKFNQELKDSGLTLKTIQTDFSRIGSQGADAYNRLAQAVLGTNQQLKQSSKLLNDMFTTFKNTVRYGISSSIFNNMANSIQKAYDYSKQLDTSLNDIRIVTDKSAESMADFAKQANEAAKGMGASTLDYTNAALIYYQQGLSDAEVAARAETTIKAANVTGQAGEEVSEQLTAVWNGYKVTAEETELYVDKLAAVAATTAADLEELSTGMSKVASAANAMGVDFDDLNAQIATIVSVTRQAPESVGTALKTIYARLGDLKVDGVDEFGVSLGEVSEQMVQMGIQILDQNGNLRDMSSVIAEVAEKWSGWTQAQRQAAAVAMAGKRQYNNLIALFDNWDMYTEALNTSTEAVGTLQHQQDIYMESTAAKLKTLKAAWQGLYDDAINEDEINAGIEALTNLVEVFDNFIDSFGGGIKSIAGFGAIISSVFNKQIADSINAANQRVQVFKNNLELAQTTNQIRMQGAIDRGDTASSQAIAANTQKQIELSQQIYNIRAGISQEQANELINYQKEIGTLEEEITLLQNQAEQTELVYADNIKISDVLKMNASELDDLNVKLGTQELVLEDEIKQHREIINFIKEQVNIEKEKLTNEEDYSTIIGHIREVYSQLNEDTRKSLETVFSEVTSNEQLLASKEKIYEITNRDLVLSKNKLSSLQAENKILQNTQTLNEKIANAKEKQNNYQQQFNQIYEMGQSAAGTTQQIVALTSALGNMAMAWSSVNSLIDTWNNKDISFGDKLLQTFITLGFTLPIVISNFAKLNDIFNISSLSLKNLTSQKIADELATKSIIATNNASLLQKEADIALDGLKRKSLIENIASQTAYNATLTEEEAILQIKEISATKHIMLSQAEATAVYKLVVARQANTTAIAAETAAQNGLNAAMTANPIGLVIVGLMALVAAIGVSIKVYDALTVSAEEAQQALTDSVSKYNTTKTELESLDKELETTKERIEELQKLAEEGSLSLVEKEELANLEAQNTDLENQLKIKQQLLKLDREQVAINAKQFVEKGGFNLDQTLENNLLGASFEEADGKYSLTGPDLNEFSVVDFESYSNWEKDINTQLAKAIDDVNNEDLSEADREMAQKAVDWYTTVLEQRSSQWIENYNTAINQLSEDYQKAKEALPALYEAEEDNPGLYSNTIKEYEQVVLTTLEAQGTLKDTLESILSSSITQKDLDKILQNQNEIINAENQTINEDKLVEQIGVEKFKDLQLYAESFGLSLYDIIVKSQELGVVINETAEEIDNTLSGQQAKVNEFLGYLNTSLSAMTKNGKLTTKELEGMEESLNALEAEYPSLAAIQDRTSTAYYNKLLAIREALEEQDKLLKQQQENQQIDEAIQIDIESNGGEEALEEKLLDICNADYEVLVSVKSDIQDDFDTAVNSMESINEMASKIGDDFIVAAEDIEELNNVFPGILSNMELVGDGTVKLNADIVKGAMEVAEAEVAADADATISKLQNQADELAAKRDAARQIATSSTNLAKHETQLDDEKGKIDTALNQLKTDNSETTSQNQQKDQGDTADNAAQAATSMANSYGKAYQTMAADALKWATAARAALNYGSGLSDTPPNIPEFAGANFQTTSNVQQIQSEKNDLSNFEDYADVGDWQEVADYYNNLADSYDEAYNSVIGKIGELTARGQGVGKSLDNISKGTGSDGKKSGSGSSSKNKDKELKKLEDEFDRYWEINKALDAIDRNLKKIDKDQENLYGKELIRSLKQENELLDNQAQLYEQLYAAQQAEAAELRGQLSTMGVSFDASSGAITNYAQAVAQALATYNAAVTAFNNGPQDEAAQKSLEAAEKAYENFKKLIERYDTLVYNEMQDTQEKLDEIWRKQLANNLKAWEVEIQLKLDFKELEREWNDFMKEVTSDFKKVFKDLRVESKNMLKDATTYVGEEGTINTIIGAVHDVTGEIDKMMSGGTSDKFESVSQAQEKLKELNDELLKSGQSLHDLWGEAWDNYLDGIDQVDEKFEDISDRYERINEELEFQGQLIELLYGDEAYALMSKYYEGMEKNTMGQIESTKQQADMWKQLFEASGASMDNQLDWDEDQKKYYENWMNAQSKLNDLVIDYIELLKKDYLNTVSDVLKELEKYVTGSSLEDINTEWERISANADKYYDSVEGAYYIQTLANKIDQSIADANNLQAQQKLMKLREKEIDYLREKENLTEYDIKAAELRYQLALKEIALEDAQNNKTGMKLTRNDQGNWSYQYVADESDIISKRQELLDTYNDLYQLASDAYEANLEALQELQEKYLESAKKIYEDDTLTEEERQAKLLDLRDWYLQEYQKLAEENQLYRNDLATAGAGLLLELYEQDQTAYDSMTETERGLVDTLTKENISDYMELEEAVKDNYQGIKDKAQEVMRDTRQDWTSGAQTIADLWNKDNGFSVKNEVTKAYDRIETANQDYQRAVDECAQKVERDFTEQGIMGAIQRAENETDSLKDKTIELVNESIPYLQALKDYVDQIGAAWQSVQDQIMAAINLIDEYLRKVGEANAAVQRQAEIAQQQAAAQTPTKTSKEKESSVSSRPVNTESDPVGHYYYTAYSNPNGVQGTWKVTSTSGQSVIVGGIDSNQNYVAAQKEAIAEALKRNGHFATGGYTGDWSDTNGKLALLDSKELVLNADDTKNFLSGINTIRDLSSSVGGSIQDAVLKAVANTALSLGSIKANGVMGNIANNNSSTDNVFNITAEFPNANSVDDIREAILSLPNIASQYANSTLK